MLGVRSYTQTYINGCRAKIDADIASYRNLAATVQSHCASDEGSVRCAIDSFEHTFFNALVFALDALFVHRLRTVEGKDGNPLNEVRVLCDSMMHNSGIVTADSAVKLAPGKSVLGSRAGDEIKLTEADFIRLSGAFFTEIERKYLEPVGVRP